MDMSRKCAKCRQGKPLSEFHKNQRYCKACQSEYSKANREWINKAQKVRYRRKPPNLGVRVAKIVFARTGTHGKTLADYGFCCRCGATKDLQERHIDGVAGHGSAANIMLFCPECLFHLPNIPGLPLSA